MIYINGKQVNFKSKDPDYEFADVVKEYHETIKDFNERLKGEVRFVTPNPFRRDPVFGTTLPPKPYSWRTTLKRVTDDGPETWVWSPSGATIKDGVATSSQPTFMVSRGSMTLNTSEDPDFIYFLTKHSSVLTGRLTISDPEAREKKRAIEMKQESTFKDLIYSDNSPLADDLDKLKMIARKWGVGDVDNRSDFAIRNALYDSVMSGEKAKANRDGSQGIAEFIDDFNFEGTVKIGALVQKAIDARSLSLNRETSEWLLTVSENQMPLSIMRVGSNDSNHPREALITYLSKNQYDVDTIEKVLAGDAVIKYGDVYDKSEVTVPLTVSLETIDTATFSDLQKTAKELGIGKECYGKKKAEIYELVKQKAY